MEEKDQQPIDPRSSGKPVEKSPQFPDSIETKDISEQTISPQDTDSKTIFQDESEKPKTTNQKPQVSDMEVHHHGHLHEKKKWKEYVFQFQMLFPAVFCGFLAEFNWNTK